MSFQTSLTLSTGAEIPQIGLGTWLSKTHEVENAVEYAIKHGYRHLDLAPIYRNQDEVGAALKKVIPSVVAREELFITSKLWNSNHREVEKDLDTTLGQLGVAYLDLYLIHWPVAFGPGEPSGNKVPLDTEVSLADTWETMVELKNKGKVKAIGVSNFSVKNITALVAATGVVPAVNQVEAHPLLPQDDLVAYCKEHNIVITAFSPLGNNMSGKPKLTDHEKVQAVAASLGATPAQVLIAWGVYRGYSVIPKSVHEERLLSNFQQVELSREDYDQISSIGHGNHTRYAIPITFQPLQWDINVFDEPEEKGASTEPRIRRYPDRR